MYVQRVDQHSNKDLRLVYAICQMKREKEEEIIYSLNALVSRKLEALCSASESLKATIPIMIPATKKTKEMINQKTPQQRESPPTCLANALASDSFTFRLFVEKGGKKVNHTIFVDRLNVNLILTRSSHRKRPKSNTGMT